MIAIAPGEHHFPCPGGCGELADECTCPEPNVWGSMRLDPPFGSLLDLGAGDRS